MIQDANILFSYINTKLRDCYATFDELIEDLDLDKAETERILNGAGYYYSAEANQFIPKK